MHRHIYEEAQREFVNGSRFASLRGVTAAELQNLVAGQTIVTYRCVVGSCDKIKQDRLIGQVEK